MTDEITKRELANRVEELESELQEMQQEQSQVTGLFEKLKGGEISRRTFLTAVSAVAGIGYTAGTVTAQTDPSWGNSTGNVGEEGKPIRYGYIQDLYTQSIDTEDFGSTFPSGAIAHKVPLETVLERGDTHTFTPATAHDIYEVDVFALSSSPDDLQITIDGDTSSSYHQEDVDGTSRSGRSNWLIGSADNSPLIGTLRIYGDKAVDASGAEGDMHPKIVGNVVGAGPGGISAGEFRVATDQISSIEFAPSAPDLDYQIDIYGRSLAE